MIRYSDVAQSQSSQVLNTRIHLSLNVIHCQNVSLFSNVLKCKFNLPTNYISSSNQREKYLLSNHFYKTLSFNLSKEE